MTQVAYLGPEATFSHIVAKKRFGDSHELIPLPSIPDIFDFVESKASRCGLVPIENSSGGTIYETVDRLVLSQGKQALFIQEELSLDVRLALVGHKGDTVQVVYSHFAPLHHCDGWLRKNLPDARREEVASTAVAAKVVAHEPHSAALSTREAAELYKLDVLHYPVAQSVPNVTQFFRVGHEASSDPNKGKTSLVASLPNTPGSLYDFLAPFKECGVNLTRILSRPIVGRPNEYVFFIDILGAESQDNVQRTLKLLQERSLCVSIRMAGSYPVIPQYTS